MKRPQYALAVIVLIVTIILILLVVILIPYNTVAPSLE